MSDKSVPKHPQAKGPAYCEKPGTSCFYDKRDICVNCLRPKGWRVHKLHRSTLDRNAGR
jgi:hypothetical protein